MSLSLAVKYRPQTFDDVIAQSSVKSILEKQIQQKTFQQAYLFCGGAGTGKTTCARIMANEINGGVGTPIEIDGASNNGVDNVRNIIDNCRIKSLDCPYKIFIVDECHMFSNGAWNAMLKILEEPPVGCIFILCTTDPQKIPNTILSRVQRFDFKRIPEQQIIERLQYIIECENKELCEERDNEFTDGEYAELALFYDAEAVEYIAKLADGGMRDSITMLNKCIDFTNNLTLDVVVETLGAADYSTMFELLYSILEQNSADAVKLIQQIHIDGKDLKIFIKQFSNFLIDVVKYVITKDTSLIAVPKIYEENIECLEDEQLDLYVELMDNVSQLNSRVKWESSPKIMIQAEVIMLCQQ